MPMQTKKNSEWPIPIYQSDKIVRNQKGMEELLEIAATYISTATDDKYEEILLPIWHPLWEWGYEIEIE